MTKHEQLLLLALAACGKDYGDVAVTPDAGAIDASTTLDAAAPDAGAEAAAPTGFCATLSPPATFCSDFDDGLLPGPWKDVNELGGATVRVDRDGVTSAPFGALMHAGSSSDDNRAAALHRKDIGVAQRTITVSFDLRVDEYPNAGDSDFDAFTLSFPTDTEPYRELQLQLDADAEVELTYQGGTTIIDGSRTVLPMKLAGGRFTHIDLKVDVAAGQFRALFDGSEAGAIHASTGGGSLELYAGDVALHKTTGSWAVRVDNVVARID